MSDIKSINERRRPKMEKECSLNEKELFNCTFVKTVLMLIVVIYHCMVYWSGSWFIGEPAYSSKWLGNIALWMNSFHIYGFTLVSGYLFYALKHERGKYSQYAPFVVNKAKRLLVPYIVVSLIWAIPFGVCFLRYGIADIIEKFLLGTSPSQLWFLLMLFVVFAIFHPLSNFFEKNNLPGVAVVLAFYGIGIIKPSIVPNVFQIFTAFTYLPLFWLGFKIRQYGSLGLRKIPSLVWIVADILIFALLRYLQGFDGLIFTVVRIGGEFVLHIVGALMAFVLLQNLADRINWKQSRIFALLSQNSMPIYLLHQQVVYVFIYWLNGILNPYVHVTFNFIGAVLISLCISLLLMKFKWTRILIGEK